MTHSQYPPVVTVVSRSHEVLTCSRCGLVMTHDGHEYDEALIISFCAGFSSVFGDEMRVDAVFCQHCLSSIAGGTDIIGCFMGGNPIGPVWRGEIQARCLVDGWSDDMFTVDLN